VPHVTTALFQSDPNPFNPATRIRFRLSHAMDVTLKVYDSAGHHVATLLNENVGGGEHVATWDGRSITGAQVGSGIYFYKLQTEEGSLTHRMVLLR
jgi:flagellar hook assembly protein FlgD